MFTQRIIVKNVFFCFPQFDIHFLFCCHIVIYIIDWIFILLFNDIRLKYILQIPYFALSKSGSCVTQPPRGVVILKGNFAQNQLYFPPIQNVSLQRPPHNWNQFDVSPWLSFF